MGLMEDLRGPPGKGQKARLDKRKGPGARKIVFSRNRQNYKKVEMEASANSTRGGDRMGKVWASVHGQPP